jgi:hypothetical protein
VLDIDKRNYYIQSYDFTMLGYLIDEEEFEVKPAVARVLQMYEVDTQVGTGKRNQISPPNPNEFEYPFFYTSGNTSLTDFPVDYRIDVKFISSENVTSYDVYINDDYYGTDVFTIQLNQGDKFQVDVTKTTPGEEANVLFSAKLV